MRDNNSLIRIVDNGILKEPGDRIEARITKTKRKVLKVHTSKGKYSAVQYPDGKLVETRTTLPESRSSK